MGASEAFISWGFDEAEDCYLIAHMWVPVAERGKGKGRAMLREALADMRAEGKAKVVKLSADSSSEDPSDPIDLHALVAFYESEGFDIEYAGEVVIMAQSL